MPDANQPPARPVITTQQITAFQNDGVVCLKGLLNSQQLQLLEQGINENIANPSPRGKVASQTDDPGQFFEDFCNWQDNPHYRRFIFESGLGEVAGLLMQSNQVRLYHDHFLVKEPGTRQPTPWHQDQPYYNVDGKQNCSMWIAVDPVARESTLEFIAGSHKGPWLMPRSFKDNQAKWFPEGALADLPDIEAARDNYPILGWEIEPGDVVCFHMLTLHAAGGVAAGRRRRVFSVRFLGDDMRHAPRPWVTSPEFPGLAERLPAGAPLNDPLFPVLWEKPTSL